MKASQALCEVDTTTPSVARVYDYLIGGKDNFEVDRRAAEAATALFPGGLPGVGCIGRANRAFLGRTVHHLADTVGIRQFLDIGTGLPTANNVHEVAQRAAPDSRIVYVDHDPAVLAHARALLTSTPQGATDYIHADLRDTDTILREAARTLDLTRPVGLLLIAILHVVDDTGEPHAIVSRLLAALPPGSHLVISHLTADVQTEAMKHFANTLTERMVENVALRDRDTITRFFDGTRLLPPGIVTLDSWDPAAETPETGGSIPSFGGIGRKP